MVTEATSGSASRAAKSAHRNGESRALDHVQLGMEAAPRPASWRSVSVVGTCLY